MDIRRLRSGSSPRARDVKFHTRGKTAPPDTPLHRAALGGHAAMIELLLKHGADVNARARSGDLPTPIGGIALGGETALHHAAGGSCTECVKILLEHGAKVDEKDARGNKPLAYAVQAGRRDAAALLIDAGAEVNEADRDAIPLLLAAYNGDVEMTKLLLDARRGYPRGEQVRIDGAPPRGRFPGRRSHRRADDPATSRGGVDPARPRGGCPCARISRRRPASSRRVERVRRSGGAPSSSTVRTSTRATTARARRFTRRRCSAVSDVASYLISRGADVNARSDYNAPLSLAVRFSHKDVVALLLQKGADARTVEYGGKSLLNEIVDFQGAWTPDRREIVEMLLDAGAEIEFGAGKEGTPLHGAVRRGQKELAELLLDRGANINAKDQYGQTPLHDAVSQKQPAMVELLIARGAEINPLDNQGHTPMYDAWGDGADARIKELLRSHGGTGAFGEPR